VTGQTVKAIISVVNTYSGYISEWFSDTCVLDYAVCLGDSVVSRPNWDCGEAFTDVTLFLYESIETQIKISTMGFKPGIYVIRGGLRDRQQYHPWGEAQLIVLSDTLSN
jgi:hypothetical protein